MDGVTLPRACKEVGIPLSRGERIIWEYRDELPQLTRIGHMRVWPQSLVEKLRDIIAREQRCAAGAR